MASLIAELKRRNVFKVGVAYIIVGWLIIQIADITAPALRLPDWTLSLVIFLVLIGFPLALFLAWAFELTPEGVKTTSPSGPDKYHTRTTGQQLNYTIMGTLALAVVFLVIDNYVLRTGEEHGAAPTNATAETSGRNSMEPAAEPVAAVASERKQVLPNSVAVLPFENLSPDPDNAYFAAGIHDTILNELSKISGMNVISRSAMLRYTGSDKTLADIAGELHVETVMEGSVQYAEGRVLVTAQLIDPETDTHLWSANYDREFAGIFALQAEIASKIAAALEAKLLPAERASIEKPMTGSPEAYTLYLRAIASVGDLGPFGFGISTELHRYLDQAIAIDPEFARAYALKAVDYASAMVRPARLDDPLKRADLERLAMENAGRALAIDPDLGLAYEVLGQVHWFNWRSSDARENFDRALQLGPRDRDTCIDYALFMVNLRRGAEAVSIAEPLMDIDPAMGNFVSAWGHFISGDVEQGTALMRDAVELLPDFPYFSIELALHLNNTGQSTEALRLLRIVDRLWGDELVEPWLLALSAYAYSRLGQPDDAGRLYARMKSLGSDYTISPGTRALASLAMDDEEAALRWLREAAVRKASGEGLNSIETIELNLYSDARLEQPEFVAARKLVGLQ